MKKVNEIKTTQKGEQRFKGFRKINSKQTKSIKGGASSTKSESFWIIIEEEEIK